MGELGQPLLWSWPRRAASAMAQGEALCEMYPGPQRKITEASYQVLRTGTVNSGLARTQHNRDDAQNTELHNAGTNGR
jgi:hypothetical protein